MIVVTYENYKGGTNNLAVAIETKTGNRATSTHGKDQAIENQRRKLRALTGKYKEVST